MSPDDRRSAVVEVAIPLLREHGAALTTKQVAEAAGIAEGTLFRAFGTKEELVQACATAVFDTEQVIAQLRAVDRDQPLDDRLVAAVGIMLDHVGRIIGLMSTLHTTGVAPPRVRTGERAHRPRMTDPEVDAAFVDLIGSDAVQLRLDPADVVNILAHLTLASAHPLFPARAMTPAEIVSVVLDGTRTREVG
jgi:AcrR family transcriptional regulator